MLNVENIQGFNGDSDGEQSMDLATPLQEFGLLLSSPLSINQGSPYVDPPSIPLPPSPPSPEPLRLPDMDPTLVSKPNTEPPRPSQTRSPSRDARIVRIEDDLVAARQDLEEKERALDELRGVLDGLHRQPSNSGEP